MEYPKHKSNLLNYVYFVKLVSDQTKVVVLEVVVETIRLRRKVTSRLVWSLGCPWVYPVSLIKLRLCVVENKRKEKLDVGTS